MPPLFFYFLKLSISLGIVYLFYNLVLRRLTFYNWNRWYLAGYSFLSLFIAVADVSFLLDNDKTETAQIIQFIPSVESFPAPVLLQSAITKSDFSIWEWMLLIFCTGFVVAAFRLIIQLISYFRLRNAAQMLSSDSIKIFQINKNIIPFSFGSSIFINQHLHTEEELKEIIRHEFVHVKQNHTVDIIWAELLCIINWYNPFAWLRHHIRQNLEFIADDKVVQSGIDKKQYQYLLLKVIGTPQFRIASNFNFSSLKKRIVMMNKLKSAKVHLVKFLFVLPLIAVLLVAFRSKINDSFKTQNENRFSISETDTIPNKDIVIKDVKLEVVSPDPDLFLIRNKGVKRVGWSENSIIIHLKNDGTETYKLDNESDVKRFKKKYGALPVAPPPPPFPPASPKFDSAGFLSSLALHQEQMEALEKETAHIYEMQQLVHLQMQKLKDSLQNKAQEISLKMQFEALKNQQNALKEASKKLKEAAGKLKENKKESRRLSALQAPSLSQQQMFVADSITYSSSNDSKAFKINSTMTNATATKKNEATNEITFETDTLIWMPTQNKLRFIGNAVVTDRNTTLKGNRIDYKINQPYTLLFINGKEAKGAFKYISNHPDKFKLATLNKEAAQKKYGNKKINGAIEINTLR